MERHKAIFILVLALSVRLIGIHFGLPELYHADEPIVVNHALAYGAGDLNPHFFKIPPLVSYLLFFIYGIYYLIGRIFGWFGGTGDFLNLFVTHPTSFYLIARILFGAFLGTFTVYLLYRLAKKFFSVEHALLSLLFFGLNFLHVRDSHYVYADIPLLAVLVLSFFPILSLTESFNLKSYLLFGALLGLTGATKYNGVLIVIPFLLVHFLKYGFKWRHLALTFLTSLAVYSILNPYSWFNFKFFLSELSEQSRSENFIGFFHHLTYSLGEGMGWLILGFSLLGMFQSFYKKDIKKIAVISFIVAYYILLCVISQPYDRYALPLIPFLTLLASDGFIVFRKRFNIQKVVYFVLIMIVVSPSVFKIGISDLLFSRKDTRTVAQEWFEHSVLAGAKVALDSPFYMPRLKPTVEQLAQKKKDLLLGNVHHKAQYLRLDAMIKESKENGGPKYQLYFLKKKDSGSNFLFSKPEIPYESSVLKAQRIEYVILGQINNEPNPLSNTLSQNAELLARFTPYRDQLIEHPLDNQPLTGGPFIWKDLLTRERNGPIINIYRLKN